MPYFKSGTPIFVMFFVFLYMFREHMLICFKSAEVRSVSPPYWSSMGLGELKVSTFFNWEDRDINRNFSSTMAEDIKKIRDGISTFLVERQLSPNKDNIPDWQSVVAYLNRQINDGDMIYEEGDRAKGLDVSLETDRTAKDSLPDFRTGTPKNNYYL